MRSDYNITDMPGPVENLLYLFLSFEGRLPPIYRTGTFCGGISRGSQINASACLNRYPGDMA